MEPEGQKIVLLAVRTGSEQAVQTQVKARLMQTYCPRYLVNLRHGGMVARCLFPGYLFVWARDHCWPTLRSLVGVRDFVRGASNQVEIVKPEVVEDLRKREGPTGYVRVDSRFVVGQHVALKDRADWAGVYLGMSNSHKARVLFSLLGASVELEMYVPELIAS